MDARRVRPGLRDGSPDDESIAAAMLGVAALGNSRTTTMRAFTREEFEGIRAGLTD